MSFGPIALLEVVVDPSASAQLTDDGVDGQTFPGTTIDGIDISEGGGLGAVGGVADPRHPGHYVRRRGSGVRHRSQGAKILPFARDDTLTDSIGDAFTDVDVLANDTYSGTPTIQILSGPTLDGAIARVVGRGSASRIRYTPPATGYPSGAQDEIVYWLRASGNARSNGRQRSQDTASLFVTIGSDPQVGKVYTGIISGGANGLDNCYDVRLNVVMDSWNGQAGVGLTLHINTGGADTSCGFFLADLDLDVDDNGEFYPVISTGPFTMTLNSLSSTGEYSATFSVP